MRLNADGTLRLAPTDLTTYVACRHASRLEIERTLGRPTPQRGRDAEADLVAELGAHHEAAYLEYLRDPERRERPLHVVQLDPLSDDAETRVRELLRTGVDVVAQAPLRDGRWFGVADVLMRVEGPSDLGGWHYEVQDTKLATTVHAAAALQLSTYARLLAHLQGTPGTRMHVVGPSVDAGEGSTPFSVTALRVDDFDAVTNRAATRFEAFVERVRDGGMATSPEPVEFCAVCPWWESCRATWVAQDHLSLVANLGGSHRAELERNGVTTRVGLAARRVALGFRPAYGRTPAYMAAAHQADVQVRSDGAAVPVVEALPLDDRLGLARLPELSRHDVYVDLEGTPLFPRGGIEYLWGWSIGDGPIEQVWAYDRAAEKRAFEVFIDVVSAHRRVHPQAHVVHFGPYEPAAFKRLMGRHATREEELDALLRAKAFVDLLPVMRQGFRVGTETYSLKALELVHGFRRDEDLSTLGPLKRAVERATVLGMPETATDAARTAVARYNADDVFSTVALHRWVEARRVSAGVPARPGTLDSPEEGVPEHRQQAVELADALMRDLPESDAQRTPEQRAQALLARLVDFEWREAKVNYWSRYAHLDMVTDDLEVSPKGVVGLRAIEVVPPTGRSRSTAVRYRYPQQDLDARTGERLYVRMGDGLVSFGAEVDHESRTITVKQGPGHEAVRIEEGFFWNHVDAAPITKARFELAQDVVDRGLDAPGRYRAARDLLISQVGRTMDGFGASLRSGETPQQAALRIALELDGGVLPIQGPPGAGKTHVAAHTIVALAEAGQRVAVTALSHDAITNLLAKVVEVAKAAGANITVGHKGNAVPEGVRRYTDYAVMVTDLEAGNLHVVGGTAWAWSREEFRQRFDTVVIDEAGQFSLATAVSVALAGRNLLLMGDPQQLAQPIQGTHPDGAEISALEHLLQGQATLPAGRGLFLPETYRMHPDLTRFVSRSFYEGRLASRPENANLRLVGTDGFDGAGIAFVPVVHSGHDGTAPEEVAATARLLERLIRPGAVWVDKNGVAHALGHDNVMVIAPFNRHVAALRRGLPASTKVGTVDRFQGQEAPVVIYALGVSSLDLAPRGVGFLFDLHRCNVAVSRARVRTIVVASPALFDEVPGAVEGLRLANAHVRLVHPGQAVDVRGSS